MTGNPNVANERCPFCNGELLHRADLDVAAIMHRLEKLERAVVSINSREPGQVELRRELRAEASAINAKLAKMAPDILGAATVRRDLDQFLAHFWNPTLIELSRAGLIDVARFVYAPNGKDILRLQAEANAVKRELHGGHL